MQNLENIQDDESPKGDETKEIILKPCTKVNQMRKAFEYKSTYNPCSHCNHFGIYKMLGHKHICTEYDGREE